MVVLAAGFLSPKISRAQGTTYISNLGQSSSTSAAVGSDEWLALGFSTGNNSSGYQLNSIQLEMANAIGNPTGFAVMLYFPVVGLDAMPYRNSGIDCANRVFDSSFAVSVFA